MSADRDLTTGTETSGAAVAGDTPPTSGAARPTPWIQVVGVVVLLTAVLAVVMTAFAWPATRSSLHDIPLGLAGPAPAVSQLEQRLAQERPGTFETHPYPDEAAARHAIEERDVYGALVAGDGGRLSVLTASAGSPVIAQALNQFAQAAAEQSGAGPADRVAVRDVVPVPADDPRGAGLGAGALPLVIGGIAAAAALSIRVTGIGRRIVGALAFAVTGGLALTAILQLWFGSLDGGYWANSAAVALAIGATSLAILGLESLLGAAGLGLGAAIMVLLGNPLSGLTTAPEMLPSGWGTLGQLLPPGAGGTLLRTVAFFPDASIARPVVVLLAWLLAGLLLCALSLTRRGRRVSPAAAGSTR